MIYPARDHDGERGKRRTCNIVEHVSFCLTEPQFTSSETLTVMYQMKSPNGGWMVLLDTGDD